MPEYACGFPALSGTTPELMGFLGENFFLALQTFGWDEDDHTEQDPQDRAGQGPIQGEDLWH